MRQPHFKLAIQIAAAFALAFWWGGLTFYSLVAVPIGVDVLGGATEQGFITRLVTQWINLSGAGTLVVLIGALVVQWRGPIWAKWTFGVAWTTMAVAQATLFVIHPRLDAMLDVSAQSVSNPDSFHTLHEFYLTVTGVQWFAGLVSDNVDSLAGVVDREITTSPEISIAIGTQRAHKIEMQRPSRRRRPRRADVRGGTPPAWRRLSHRRATRRRPALL